MRKQFFSTTKSLPKPVENTSYSLLVPLSLWRLGMLWQRSIFEWCFHCLHYLAPQPLPCWNKDRCNLISKGMHSVSEPYFVPSMTNQKWATGSQFLTKIIYCHLWAFACLCHSEFMPFICKTANLKKEDWQYLAGSDTLFWRGLKSCNLYI